MNVAVVIVGIVAALGVCAWFFLNRKNPETTATHAGDELRSDDGVDDDPGRNRPGPGA